jgi:hypothetical protein
MMSNDQPPFEVGMRGVKWLGWVGLAFFGFCMVASWFSEPLILSLMFLPFVALSLLVLSTSGSLRGTQASLELENWWGVYRIEWNEIERVETGQSAMVLCGVDSRLSIPLPKWWSGDAVRPMTKFVQEQFVSRSLPVVHTFRSDYVWQKNTKHGLSRRRS